MEVAIGVDVGEREGVVFEEGGVKRKNESALNGFHHLVCMVFSA